MKQPSEIFRKRPRRAAFSAMTVLFGAILLAGNALAFAPGPGTGNNDPYNPTDATPDCVPSAGYLDKTIGTGAGQNPPSAQANCAPPPITWITDTLSGASNDNAWGQGDKSDCFLAKQGGVDGACVTQVFGIGASKTDLQYHGIGIANATVTDGTTHSFLYSGIKRLLAGGISSSNANYNVEVNQDLPAYQPAAPICSGTVPAGGGSCNMWRSAGDLLFMTDWGGANSSCSSHTPDICAYVWIDFSTGTGKTPSPAGSTCFNAKAAPCWGLLPNTSADLGANADKAAGSIDSSTSTFTEIGVDLTQSGLVAPGACFTANDVWAHSRSSSSFSAELKDFIFGHVSISTCTGTTTLLHQTDSTGADFDPAITGLELNVAPGSYVKDVATVTAGATGSVNFRYYSGSTALADCTADTAGTGGTNVSTNALSGGTPNTATSSAVPFSAVGDYYWRAFYIPGNLSASASTCNEIVHVQKIATAISTTQKWLPQDTATITPAVGGTVTFSLYENGTCSGAAAATFSDSTAPFETNNGTYYTASKTISWSASFAPTDTTTYLPSTTTRCETSVLTITNDSGPFPPGP